MDIEFDAAKDAINLEKHGVSLAFGAKVFEDTDHVVVSSARPIDGEDRFKVLGVVGGRLWTAVYVLRNGNIRFISVRKSNDGEQKAYDRS